MIVQCLAMLGLIFILCPVLAVLTTLLIANLFVISKARNEEEEICFISLTLIVISLVICFSLI
jgi:hypothetical protein